MTGLANMLHNRDMGWNVTRRDAVEDAVPCERVTQCEALHCNVCITIAPCQQLFGHIRTFAYGQCHLVPQTYTRSKSG